MLAFDDRGLETQLCRTNGGDIAPRTRTDDDDVVILSHVFPAFVSSDLAGEEHPVVFLAFLKERNRLGARCLAETVCPV
ncbi:hypothetical protein D3C78_1871410 [compost metagenome]